MDRRRAFNVLTRVVSPEPGRERRAAAAWRGPAGAILAACLLSLRPGAALADTPPDAGGAKAGPALSPADQNRARDLATSITTSLPPPSPSTAPCPAAALAMIRDSAEAVIAKASPPHAVAIAALGLARDESPPLDACRLAALEDSATEIAGQGETVDDGDAVRGFTLFTGPLPPDGQRRAPSPPAAVKVVAVADAPAPPAKTPVKKTHRRRRPKPVVAQS